MEFIGGKYMKLNANYCVIKTTRDYKFLGQTFQADIDG